MHQALAYERGKIGARWQWLSWTLLVFSIVIAVLSWYRAEQELVAFGHALLERRLDRAGDGFKQRIVHYGQVLRTAAWVFHAKPDISQDEWSEYIDSLHVHQVYPGVQNFGFAPVLTREAVPALLASERPVGGRQFSLRPAGDRDAYVPVTRNAPLTERTLRSFGYDMYSETIRRTALDLARDSGRAVLTSRVVLITERKNEEQPGLLMYLPIYRGGRDPQNLESRRNQLVGYVFAAFRVNELVGRALGFRANDHELQILDEDATGENRILYSSAPAHELAALKKQDFVYSGEHTIEVGDRHYRVSVITRPEAVSSLARMVPTLVLVGLPVVGLLLFALSRAVGSQRARATELERADMQNRQVNEQLNLSVKELERRAGELGKLREMNDWVQHCASVEEGAEVVAKFAQQLFETNAGGVLLANSAGQFRAGSAARWGPQTGEDELLHAEDCWALRRDKLYLARAGHNPVQCKHVDASLRSARACAPLSAQGETFGMLHIQEDDRAFAPLAERKALIELFAEQAALSLGSLKLREKLRSQSVRDPLTGLFNRRYLEETLTREERRAERMGTPISIIVIDIDHFKRLNDTHGHAGGDAVLKAVASMLRSQLRESDIACRYGGEEFVLALPGASLGHALKKAEQLRQSVAQISVDTGASTITGVTISLGVGAYPDDAANSQELIQRADLALYAAKKSGRNQVRSVTAPAAGQLAGATATPVEDLALSPAC